MLIQLVELPRMEVGHEIAIMTERTTTEPAIESEGKVVTRKPEEREANKRRHRSRDLQYSLLHKVRAWCTQMHVAPGDEGGVERGIVAIACLIDLRLRDGHHTRLTIASHRDSSKSLESVLRLLQVGRLKGPVVVTM